MAIAVGDIIRIAARISMTGVGDFVNVFHVKIGTLPAGGDSVLHQDLVSWVDSIYEDLVPSMPEQAVFADVNLFNVTQSAPIGSFPWTTQTAGEGGANALPPQVAAFVRGTTGRSRVWGKKFIGPLREEDNSGLGTISSTLFNRLVTFAGNWIASHTAASGSIFQAVVFCRQLDEWLFMTEAVVKNIYGTIRRRKPGVGS